VVLILITKKAIENHRNFETSFLIHISYTKELLGATKQFFGFWAYLTPAGSAPGGCGKRLPNSDNCEKRSTCDYPSIIVVL
jgi:hypothetical protein